MIELLTFTGVDSETPLAGLSDLARQYPRVEFGVLVGSHIGGIFPARSVVDDFKAYANAMGIGDGAAPLRALCPNGRRPPR